MGMINIRRQQFSKCNIQVCSQKLLEKLARWFREDFGDHSRQIRVAHAFVMRLNLADSI